MGVISNPDGTRDYSKSLRVLDASVSNKKANFQQVLNDSQTLGLGEDKLRILVQTLSRQTSPLLKRGIASQTANEVGSTKDEILSLARRYQREKTRLSENGELLHYHQTSVQNFASAARDGALLSYNKLKEMGKTPSSSGSRPDVVQMTRDKYDNEGNLKEHGLVDNLGLGAAGGSVVLVFDESVMDIIHNMIASTISLTSPKSPLLN